MPSGTGSAGSHDFINEQNMPLSDANNTNSDVNQLIQTTSRKMEMTNLDSTAKIQCESRVNISINQKLDENTEKEEIEEIEQPEEVLINQDLLQSH